MSQVYKNVQMLYEKFPDKIKSDEHLILLYWKYVDLLDVNKERIITADFLNRSTKILAILQCKQMYEIAKEEELNK